MLVACEQEDGSCDDDIDVSQLWHACDVLGINYKISTL